jgi:hypothetical protein
VVAFDGTVTVLGTATAELLLARFTTSPSPGAGAVNARVHASMPDPVKVALLQESVLNAAEPEPVVPVPLRVITDESVVEELLAIANCPVAGPAAAGLN